MSQTTIHPSWYRRRKMIWLSIIFFLAIMMLYFVYIVASQGTTSPWVNFPIYQNTKALSAVIDWPYVAWISWPEVLIKDMETGLIRDLTADFPCQPIGSGRGDLAIYGEWVVGSFSCDYPNSYEIHALNLNTQELIMIPSPAGLPSQQAYASEPTIYGQYIVWQQEDWTVGRSDIILFDLQSRTSISLTQTLYPIIEIHPEIYQNWVGWNTHDLSSGDNFIALYNLSSSEQITIPLAFPYDTEISLDSEYLVWTDFRNGGTNADVYGYDLTNRQELPLITGPNNQGLPVIRDRVLIYRDQTIPVSLYVYHLDSQETHLLFQELPEHNIHPHVKIDNNIVVWIDSDANGPQATVYGARQLPERFFLPIFRQP